jgi:FtsP/CotA-like multicopper oxidase with cupredoxin domain
VTNAQLRGPGALVLLAFAALGLGSGGTSARATARSTTRVYWIAAVPMRWNIVPNEHDAINHVTFTPAKTTFDAIVYKRFTAGWERELPNNPSISGDNDGIPGPLIHARVGDRIVVHFKNLDVIGQRPHSMHFHGVHYGVGSDGAFVPGFSGRGANVQPGESFTYHLVAGSDSVGVWPYHDHSPSMMESIAGGLYGALSISGRRERAPDREFVVFFESQLGFMTIDGRAFVGNTPVFHSRIGDVVQWDVLALGDDHHTFHVHGHRWIGVGGRPEDTKTIGPAESFRIRWREDALGAWLYHCHVEGHMERGMIGLYRVSRR